MNLESYLSFEAEGQLDILRAIQNIRTPLLDQIFQLITQLGETHIYIIITAVIFWSFNKQVGYRIIFVLTPVGFMNAVLKNIFKIERPIGQEGIESLRIHTANSYSFPSGHTMGAVGFWGCLMINLKKRVWKIVSMIIILLVAFSRLYLGVHTLIDVSWAIILGYIIFYIFNALFSYIERSKKPYLIFLTLLPLIFYPVMEFDNYQASKYYAYSAGFLLSTSLGYFLDMKYFKFTTPETLHGKILRQVVGLTIIGILFYLLSLLPSLFFYRFIQYFIFGISITFCVPILFYRMKIFR